MSKYFRLILSIIIVSLFYFPFSFVGIGFFNTKLIFALFGIVLFAYNASTQRTGKIPKKFTNITISAIIFSLICLFSVVYNNSFDFTYVTYFISMWVWLSGAYFTCYCLKKLQGVLTLRSLSDTLILVCITQCILALLIDNNDGLKLWVDSHIEQGQDMLNEVKRIYGIGASLDVAGTRFAVVLLLIANILSTNTNNLTKYDIPKYLFAFIIITVIGNMIARTTSVGVVLSIIYIVIQLNNQHATTGYKNKLIRWSLGVIAIAIPISIYFYYSSPSTMKLFRFAFEGFFNYFEKGEWSIASNEKLGTMYVFPETLKTWIIGDGYFDNPRNTDPYYTGELTGGYYMNTDVGYLRFIFYCGLSGLIAFSIYIIRCAYFCKIDFPKYKLLFSFLTVLNFIIWFKVATDIFLIFALILMIRTVNNNDNSDEEDENQRIDEDEKEESNIDNKFDSSVSAKAL